MKNVLVALCLILFGITGSARADQWPMVWDGYKWVSSAPYKKCYGSDCYTVRLKWRWEGTYKVAIKPRWVQSAEGQWVYGREVWVQHKGKWVDGFIILPEPIPEPAQYLQYCLPDPIDANCLCQVGSMNLPPIRGFDDHYRCPGSDDWGQTAAPQVDHQAEWDRRHNGSQCRAGCNSANRYCTMFCSDSLCYSKCAINQSSCISSCQGSL